MESPSTHRYNTLSITHCIHHVITLNNTATVLPMEMKKENKHHQCADYDIRVDTRKYEIKVEPTDNYIHCETTGKILGYMDPVKKDALVRKK